MVGLVIVSHSAALADGVTELAREMGGGEVAIEAAGGMEDGEIGTDAERVRAAVERVRSPEGVLVLMDLGSALMSAEMAVEMTEEDGGPIRLSEAPLVEGAVAAAALAGAGASLDEVAREARGALRGKTEQLGGGEAEDEAAGEPAADTDDPGAGAAPPGGEPARPSRASRGALRGGAGRPRRPGRGLERDRLSAAPPTGAASPGWPRWPSVRATRSRCWPAAPRPPRPSTRCGRWRRRTSGIRRTTGPATAARRALTSRSRPASRGPHPPRVSASPACPPRRASPSARRATCRRAGPRSTTMTRRAARPRSASVSTRLGRRPWRSSRRCSRRSRRAPEPAPRRSSPPRRCW